MGSSRSSRSGEEQEQAAERDATALAAGERGHVTVAVGHAERVHRPVERGVEVPGVGAVDLLLHLCLLGQQRVVVGVGLGEPVRDLVEAVEQVAERTDAVLDVPADVLARVEVGLLRQPADARARRPGRRGRWTSPRRRP